MAASAWSFPSLRRPPPQWARAWVYERLHDTHQEMRQDSLAQNAGSAEARREASAVAGGKKQLGKNPPAPSSTVTASNARSPGGGSPASVRVFLSYAWRMT